MKIIYKIISKKRIKEFNEFHRPDDMVFRALKYGEFNNAICENFRLTSWDTENVHIKNFIWKKGKFRGDFKNCILSDGEISQVDFWDSKFSNVIFRNISFFESEINSSYSTNYIFKLENLVFENCIFDGFSIGQAVNSDIFFKNCKIIDSDFRIKSSFIEFYQCETKNDKSSGLIRVRVCSPVIKEPIKIKECSFFSIGIIGDAIDTLNFSAEQIRLRWANHIKNIIIHCKSFLLDSIENTNLRSGDREFTRSKILSGEYSAKNLDTLEIVASKYGAFRMYNLKIKNLNISMIQEKPEIIRAYRHLG